MHHETRKWKTFVFVAVQVSLASSILLNLFLYARLRKYYTLLYAVELDPLGLSYFQNSVDLDQSKDNLSRVVFFGDSRAAQWPNPQLENFAFLNRGIGNQTSAQAAGRFDAHLKPLQPEVVIIQVGINDLKTIPLFPGRTQEIIADCEANLSGIIQNSLEMGSTVIITTIFPAGQIPLLRKLVWSDEIGKAIEEVNHHIRSLSQDHVIVFDAAAILSDPNGQIRREYVLDELHLNERGYEALNLELVKVLANLNKKAP